MIEKPFSQACENNQNPILQELKRALSDSKRVLEIGSGTGQHAVYFARHLTHLTWQTSDQKHYHDGINAWIQDEGQPNVLPPFELCIGQHTIPSEIYDAIYSANTAHIMQRHEVEALMEQVSNCLPKNGIFCQYGPFTVDGEFSSESNRQFHSSLLERGFGGYRDVSELVQWAGTLSLKRKIDMPANNYLLVWHKTNH